MLVQLADEPARPHVHKLRSSDSKEAPPTPLFKIDDPFVLTLQVPCWLRPRDRTRSPEVLNNASRPTTLPLRIPPRISITQADANRFARSLSSAPPPTAASASASSQTFCCSRRAAVTKQKMASQRVTRRWGRRVQASRCTPPSRARGESPSCTAPTRTTTCPPRRSRGTRPSPAKGEKKGGKEVRVSEGKKWLMFSPAVSQAHS